MSASEPVPHYYQEDEIDLKQLFRSLAQRKWFIIGFTGFITLLAVVYSLIITPTYQASISFVSPSQSSILQLNKIKLTSETSETSETVYRKFLNTMISINFQKKVFEDNNYFARLNPENKPIENVDDYIGEFIESIQIKDIKTKKDVIINYENPLKFTMEGGSANIMSSFLNDLANAADSETISNFLDVISQKINIRLNEISKQKELLLTRAKQDRLSQIKRIKEADQQKIDEINGQIARLRVKAKKDRLNKIQVLSDAATIAESLGITENNFKVMGDAQKSNTAALTVAIGDNQELPQWYLFGSKALVAEIEVLRNRDNDDPYVPEIVNLQNTLKEIQSNQTLRTLESREDDSPFIAEINQLDVEAIKLKSISLDSTGINAMQISQYAYPEESPITPKKRQIVAVAFVAGFILSIFLVFIMNTFRQEDEKVAS